jgi:hypothetical protein
MDQEKPKCPRCKTAEYVVQNKGAAFTSAVAGMSAGGYAGYKGWKALEKIASLALSGKKLGAAIIGAAVGAGLGLAAGRKLEEARGSFHCNGCDKSVQG